MYMYDKLHAGDRLVGQCQVSSFRMPMSKVSKKRKEALCFNLILFVIRIPDNFDLGVTPGILKLAETSKRIG
jgi:hypothetical protein